MSGEVEKDINNKFVIGDYVKIDYDSSKYMIIKDGFDSSGKYIVITKNYFSENIEEIIIYLEDLFRDLNFYYSKDEKKYLKMIESIKLGKMIKIKDGTGKMILASDGVRTLDGIIYDKKDVIYLQKEGGFLHKDDENLVVDGFETKTSANIVYMHKKRALIVHKILSVNLENNDVSLENKYTCKNNYDNLCNVFVSSDKMIRVINSDKELMEMGLIEHMNDGCFYTKKSIVTAPSKQLKYREFNWVKKITGDKSRDSKFGLFSPSFRAFDGHKYTYGVEFECSKSYVPNHLSNKLNLLCVRDGSVAGDNDDGERGSGEYVTGVLVGDTGLQQLQIICTELCKRSDINKTCGLHIHIGGASFSNSFNVFAYKLGLILENELFEMLPPSRRRNDFCRPLPRLNLEFENIKNKEDLDNRVNNYYTEIFKLMAKEGPSSKLNKNMNHPRGSKVGYDHSHPRYSWLNFIPSMFNTRSSKDPSKSMTLEFRSHSATTNFTKTKNWLKICMAFVYFADNNQQDIMNNYVIINGNKKPINLNSILEIAFPNTHKNLIEYVDKRKEIFSDNNKEKSVNAESSEYKKNRDVKNVGLKELIN